MGEENSQQLMVECENLVKIYKTSEIEVMALQGLDMTIEKGELTAIIGNSGSGKSTLLNMLGGLDKPSVGKLKVDGIDLSKLSEKGLQKYMLETVGFIWQNNARNLIPYMTALQNVEIPMMISKFKNKRERALELLDKVGMSHRIHSRLGELSGGEQQRVAMAIALTNNPKLLLADEPTGAVDSENTHRIMELFRKINQEDGVTILIVTHDRNIASIASLDEYLLEYKGSNSKEFKLRDQIAVSYQKQDYIGEVVMTPSSVPYEMMETYKDTIRIKLIEAEDIIDKVKKGDTAKITRIKEERRDIVVVPTRAVKMSNGLSYVYVLEEGIRVEKGVEVGLKTNSVTEIISGLKEGELVIVD